MTRPEGVAPLPLSAGELATAREVFAAYGIAEELAPWEELRRRALETSRPFRPYDSAHAIGAAIAKALGDYPPDSVGGAAILRGWHAEATGGARPPNAWPYLALRGWHAAKAHASAY